MILFQPALAQAILEGRKTVTRRPCVRGWTKPRVKVGREYQARTRRFGKPFAGIRVIGCAQESRPMDFERRYSKGGKVFLGHRPWMPLDQECKREGFGFYADFTAAWVAMHGEAALNEPCWRIAFVVVEGSERPEAIGREPK